MRRKEKDVKFEKLPKGPITPEIYNQQSLDISSEFKESKDNRLLKQINRGHNMSVSEKIDMVNTIIMGHRASRYIKIKLRCLHIHHDVDKTLGINFERDCNGYYKGLEEHFKNAGWHVKSNEYRLTIANCPDLSKKFKGDDTVFRGQSYLRHDSTQYDFWMPEVWEHRLLKDLRLFSDRIEIVLYGLYIPELEICRSPHTTKGSKRLPYIKFP